MTTRKNSKSEQPEATIATVAESAPELVQTPVSVKQLESAVTLPSGTIDKKTETVVYVGESLQGGSLQQFSVFKNGIPAMLEPQIKECPAIKALMVPISSLAQARQNLSIQGTSENVLNAQIQKYVRGEK